MFVRHKPKGRNMEIKVRENDNVAILDLQGEIRLSEHPEPILRDHIKREIDKGKLKIILNFKNLEFIDSSGIGELVASYVSVKNAGGKLRIVSVPDKIMLILEYTSLGNIIEVFDSEANALQDFI